MTYLSDRAKSKRRTFKFIFTIVVLAVVSFGWIQIRSTLVPVVEPVFVTSHSGIKKILNIPYAIVNYFRSRDSFQAKITSLERRTEELENQIASLQAENTLLLSSQEIVNGESEKEKTRPNIVMYPLAQDITKLYSTILLSKGFKDGIVSGSLIYIRGRQAVCIIEELHAKTSLCKLLSASGNSVEGVTSGTEQNIPLTGDGGGNYVALVPKESNFTVGEGVFYKADQTMKLGDIVDIKNDPQDIFVRIYIRGTYNPVTSSLFYVDKE